MKMVRYILWGLVVLSAVLFAWGYFAGGFSPNGQISNSGGKLGGSFSLIRHDGSPITDKDLLGKPHAIFFGFTNCPDVCPTTLYEMTTWYEALGKDGDKIDAYFVSVDPERDTQEMLSEYMSAFDSRITGITGEPKAVMEMAKSFKVYSKKVPLDGDDYTMDHTATVFLMNAKGEFVRSISYGENSEVAVQKLRKMING